MAADRGARRLRALILGAALVSFGRPLLAQEDESAEASRAKRAPAEARLSLSQRLGVFGGIYVEDPRDGVLVEAEVAGALKLGAERLRLGLGYTHDPFATKTFNFSDEDQAGDHARLVQSMHELEAHALWQSRPFRRLKTTLGVHGDLWFPKSDIDRRAALKSSAEARFGATRGPYAALGVEGRVKKFPNYLVSDRRIDQWEIEGSLELGHRLSRHTGLHAGVELTWTDYLDARYDALSADGTVVRSDESKDYFTRVHSAELDIGELRFLTLELVFAYEINDSRHYDRRMTGRDESGALVAKFIPDYYDYVRQRLTFALEGTLSRRLKLRTDVEYWVRDFDTYEARTADNVWTGELRRDECLELGGELSFRVRRFDLWGTEQGLFLTAFGSQLRRRSNMRREESLATNFDVTRVFLGLEVRPP